jgi:hypothetical protein
MVASYYLVCTIWLTTVIVIEWKNISRIWLSIQTNLILPRDQSETSDTPLCRKNLKYTDPAKAEFEDSMISKAF